MPVALAVDRVVGTGRIGGAEPEGPAPAASALAIGLGSEAVSGYAPARPGSAGAGDFALVDLPRLLRRYLP
ncbi:hypothetical protein [Methylobacterium durans]|uniref:hypothetical protein n=1 Tax=Methylobacterium durans TaxID=2202825 RepID=UPI003001814E